MFQDLRGSRGMAPSMWTCLVGLSCLVLTVTAQDLIEACPDIAPDCRMACEFGYKKDARGCLTCQCELETCKDVQCTPGKVCMVFSLTASGHKISRCVDPRLPAKCQPAVDSGPCRAQKSKYFYNTETDSCEAFLYGGCPGNDNVFDSSEECSEFCVPQEACSEVSCTMYCEHGFKKDARGCDTCQCNEEAPTEACSPVMCTMYCEHGFKKDARGCDTCQCNEEAPTEACPPVLCRMYCEHGFKKDVRGCEICQCDDEAKDEACSAVSCAMYCDHGFKRDERGCDICECNEIKHFRKMPLDCSPVVCSMYCQYGFKKDARGCETCECAEQCSPVMCEMYCENGFKNDARGCQICECLESGVVNPLSQCSGATCLMACEYGFKKDSRGCQLCSCAEPGENCLGVQCLMDCPNGRKVDSKGCETCECIQPEHCPEQVTCLMNCPNGFTQDRDGCNECTCAPPPADCPPVMCAMYCDHGFQRDARGCDVCRCNELTPCDSKQCRMFCEFGFKKDQRGCDLCQCEDNPCNAMECPPGNKCVSKRGKQPRCVEEEKRTWCSNKRCRMFCENGFKSDQFGCKICKCLDDPKPECKAGNCRMECPFGYKYDENGCRGCQCLPDPCSVKGCDMRHVCEATKPDCPMCPSLGVCIGHSQVQRIMIQIHYNHEVLEDIDVEHFKDLFRRRMSYLLGLDEEYIRGIVVVIDDPDRTSVTFHAVSFGSGNIISNYQTFENDIHTHQEGTSIKYQDVEFVPEHRSLVASYFRDPEFYVDDNTRKDENNPGASNGVIIGCSIAGAIALILLIVVIVFIVKAKKPQGMTKPNVAYKKAPAGPIKEVIPEV